MSTQTTVAEHIIVTKLGGISATARLLNKPKSTVQTWLEGGLIPAHHQQPIIDAARKARIEITPEDFFIKRKSR